MKNQLPKLNINQIWMRIANTEEVKSFIINLNTEEQLFEKGIDSTGNTLTNSLGNTAYAPLTVKIKRTKSGKGSKVSNITLFMEGDYYKSHKVVISKRGFEITSDPNKETTNLYTEWGKDIVGLTDASLQKLIDFLLIKFIKYTREVIFKR